MNPAICLASILILLLGVKWTYGDPACPTCPQPLHVIYNERKANISTLLAQTETGSSAFTSGLKNLTEAKFSTNSNDKIILTSLISELETGIIQNDSYSNDQKLRRIGMKLDQLFLNFPAIEAAIRYEKIGSWGPLCDFSYIIDELNIPSFWEIVSTPGTTTTCLLHDLILTAAKDNLIIQRDLYLKNCPCSKSVDMVSDVVNIDQDTPNPDDQLVLKSLELPGYDMTVNQVQRVAKSYHSSVSLSCRRLRDTLANYDATISSVSIGQALDGILKNTNTPTYQQSPVQFCSEFFSESINKRILLDPKYVKIFNSIFWNIPYGSMYDNIIYYDCQLSALKENAPDFYN